MGILPDGLFTLQGLWFLLAGVFLIGYSITDGFDLGSAFPMIFMKKEHDRIALYNSVAPVWDGNEVWLIAGGGMLFAAFPTVYAASFSGFYLAILIVLWALIGRAVAFEYRNKRESMTWRHTFDFIYWLGNVIPAILFGVAVGNAVVGVPIDQDGVYHGTFFTLLRPVPLAMGLVSFFMFAMHGAAYLLLKTEGAVFEMAKKYAGISVTGYVLSVILTNILAMGEAPYLYKNYFTYPVLFVIPLAMFIGVVLYVYLLKSGKYDKMVYASGVVNAFTVLNVACASFPVLMRSSINPDYSLTIFNASSSTLTLTVMLIVTIIFMPIVLYYTRYAYKVFSGKVSGEKSYY